MSESSSASILIGGAVAPLQAMLWPVVDFGVGPAWSRVPDSRLFDTLTVRWPLYLGDATACSNLVATRTYFAFDQWKSPARSTLETVTGNAPLALALYDALARALSTAPTAASRSGQNHVIQGPATPDRNTVLPHAGAPLKVDFHVDNGERGRCRGGERCCAGFCEPTCGEPLPTPHTPSSEFTRPRFLPLCSGVPGRVVSVVAVVAPSRARHGPPIDPCGHTQRHRRLDSVGGPRLCSRVLENDVNWLQDSTRRVVRLKQITIRQRSRRLQLKYASYVGCGVSAITALAASS